MSADQQPDVYRPNRANRRRQAKERGDLRGTYAERLQLLAYATNFRRQLARRMVIAPGDPRYVKPR